MTDFLDRLLGKNRKSANQAKERLALVLIHDRTNMTSSALEALKDELIEVISRHIDIDPTAVNIEMNQDGRQQRLIADIPIRGPKRRGR
ncbi:MAG TPA: cell division topological specificity factor MinE [Chloroflexi bacterium]|nr:cell division topological specificity factor MinE [Chloroflexota bacterium]HBY06292.1 cell division topological specificity factor MinE [Chloroflexota bacterium]